MKAILLVLMLVLCSLIVIAVPPFQQGAEVFTQGYDIEYPKVDTVKQGNTMSFHFHVFNISNGVPIQNETISCYFHLYNVTGSHSYITEVRNIETNFDFEVKVNGGNFSRLGECFYIFQCNSTVDALGGFVSVPLSVTPNGVDYVEINNIQPAIIALCIFSLFYAAIGFFMWKGKEDKHEKT